MHAQLAAYTVSIGPLSKECRMNHDERAIRELFAMWLRATAEGDVAQLLRLLDDDVAFIMPGQPLMRGREAYAPHCAPCSKHSASRRTTIFRRSSSQAISPTAGIISASRSRRCKKAWTCAVRATPSRSCAKTRPRAGACIATRIWWRRSCDRGHVLTCA